MNVRYGKSSSVSNLIICGGFNALKIEKICTRTKIATCQALPSFMAYLYFQTAIRSPMILKHGLAMLFILSTLDFTADFVLFNSYFCFLS